MYMFSKIILLLCILLSVAFFTLFERKILGYSHLRWGPNKNFFQGISQPINDLLKLFTKVDKSLSLMYTYMYMIIPFFMTVISLIMWLILTRWGSENTLKFFFIIFMILNGLSVFFFLGPGWSSGSFYSTLGSYRSSSQVISYEGLFFFSILILMFFMVDYSMSMMIFYSSFTFLLTSLLFFSPVWLCSIVAESNRSPFDFAEGESELVSGFNTEYGGGFFSFIFLSEYMSIMFLCFMTSIIMSNYTWISIMFFMFFMFFYVWIRVSFPRLRYDKLMIFSWKSMMFLVTGIIIFYYFLLNF